VLAAAKGILQPAVKTTSALNISRYAWKIGISLWFLIKNICKLIKINGKNEAK